MFSRILSGKKKGGDGAASPASAHDPLNARRSPTGDKEQSRMEGPRAIFFRSASAREPAELQRLYNTRSPSPPSTSAESRGNGVFELDNRLLSVPKALVGKKSSEPNVLLSPRGEKMRKSNSQPLLATRKSGDVHRSGSKGKSKGTGSSGRDNGGGFLDRAFENAASVTFDESEDTEEPTSSSEATKNA
jgi:hypothetical protein